MANNGCSVVLRSGLDDKLCLCVAKKGTYRKANHEPQFLKSPVFHKKLRFRRGSMLTFCQNSLVSILKKLIFAVGINYAILLRIVYFILRLYCFLMSGK